MPSSLIVESNEFGLKGHKTSEPFSHLTISTATATPFQLAEPDDILSVSTHNSDSTMDGIDVLGAEPSPKNFMEWSHQRSGRIVTSQLFKRGVLLLILLNSIVLGIRTFPAVRASPHWTSVCDSVVHVFLILFSVELVIDIAHYQRKTFKMGWVCFDMFVILLSWYLSTDILVLRAFRLIRALRKASGVADLKFMVKALLRVIPKVMALGFLMLLMLYIFGVLFTGFFQDMYEEKQTSEDYFGQLDTTMLTLFQIMTMGRLWSNVSDEVSAVYPWGWLPFILFVSVSTFFFGSLVVAVMSETVSVVGQERIWKPLQHARGEQSSYPSNMVASGSDNNNSKAELQRLEQKMDDLAITVGQLIRMQLAMQESLNRLSQQEVARSLMSSTSNALMSTPKAREDRNSDVRSI